MTGDPIFKNAKPALSPRAQALFDRMTVAADAVPTLDSRYLVKGWLDRGAASVVYGEPGAGKTFLGLDLSHHVAAGRDWHGARVNGGPVLYILAEGGKAVLNRVAALRDRDGVPLWCLPASVDFCRSTDDATALLEVLAHVKAHHGEYALIVIDTLARAMAQGQQSGFGER